MKNYLLAWRNLWRNKRRTLITAASVFFAVFFALVMRSLQLGTYDHMFRNAIESYTGYIQVQHQDFWDTKSVDYLINDTPELERLISEDKNVNATIPRFESFALVSSGTLTKGVLVIGIDPEKEKWLSDIRSKLVRYKLSEDNSRALKEKLPEKYAGKLDMHAGKSYSSMSSLILDIGITENDTASVLPILRKYTSFNNGFIEASKPGALLGDRLATYLKASIGDTIVLIGQGYHGTTAAGKYRVDGIVRMPTPDLDNKIIYLPVGVCQELYNAPGMLTSIAIGLKDNSDKEIGRMLTSLASKIEKPMRVIGWREMNELMINQMDADSKSGMVMIAILYMVIAFGIFGTVLMMTAERRREFGMLVAVGMQKTKLAIIVTIEMLFVGLMGVLSGSIAALPVIFYGYYHPIRFSGEMGKMYEDYGMEPVMPFMPVDWYFVWQIAVVAIIVGIAIIYPVRKILRMKVVNSLRA